MNTIHRRFYEGFNHRLRSFAGGRWASHCRPTSVLLLMTERCNARCVHCDIWKNRGKEDSPTSLEWKEALSGLRRWLGPVHTTMTGGEALLVPHTVDLVAHASSLGLLVELLTHGYWRDQRRIIALAHAKPWRITFSLDGLGETHDQIRGRRGFFERTANTIETLKRIRKAEKLGYTIRLKTVIMRQNLHALGELAEFATQDGVDIFYQPIEQNYNTDENPEWFDSSGNWPDDPEAAVAAVEGLIQLKREGMAIANSFSQLEVMIPYFRNPDAWRLATQSHTAHERRATCSALGLIQVQSNGDVRVCSRAQTIGNIKHASLREIWQRRPHWWEGGCCLDRGVSLAEQEVLSERADYTLNSLPTDA